MKISERQIIQLIQVLVDSLCIVGGGSPFKFHQEFRRQLADEIINQQSEELKDVSEELKYYPR